MRKIFWTKENQRELEQAKLETEDYKEQVARLNRELMKLRTEHSRVTNGHANQRKVWQGARYELWQEIEDLGATEIHPATKRVLIDMVKAL